MASVCVCVIVPATKWPPHRQPAVFPVFPHFLSKRCALSKKGGGGQRLKKRVSFQLPAPPILLEQSHHSLRPPPVSQQDSFRVHVPDRVRGPHPVSSIAIARSILRRFAPCRLSVLFAGCDGWAGEGRAGARGLLASWRLQWLVGPVEAELVGRIREVGVVRMRGASHAGGGGAGGPARSSGDGWDEEGEENGDQEEHGGEYGGAQGID